MEPACLPLRSCPGKMGHGDSPPAPANYRPLIFIWRVNFKGGKTTAPYILLYSRKMVNGAQQPWQPARAANSAARLCTVANRKRQKWSEGGATCQSKTDWQDGLTNQRVGKHRTAVGKARLLWPIGLQDGHVWDFTQARRRAVKPSPPLSFFRFFIALSFVCLNSVVDTIVYSPFKNRCERPVKSNSKT